MDKNDPVEMEALVTLLVRHIFVAMSILKA